MGKLLIKYVRINIPAKVGPVNEPKITKLQDVMGKDFPVATGLGVRNFIFVNPLKGMSMFINAQQISFGFDEVKVTPDFSLAQQYLDKAFDTLLLDKKGKAVIQIAGHYDVADSSFDRSLTDFLSLDKEALISTWPELMGIGLRFIAKKDDDLFEFKLEPLLKDKSLFYVEGVFNIKAVATLTSITKSAEDAYTYFIGKVGPGIESHFIK